ncbi:Inositol-pentakisphosphate 2-kinase [Clydaea vesicula]|uniref:Inositol-pentakisphosphate 2-kinase n=1 Tax=Clydaea vesicula TaxID=447962 RepID=A0AAD5Y387_9FUNG|nr:Inositol-pentakisphosphate 2-kinase [Clydaea vesicula]
MSKIQVENLKYVGEGNANIVFSTDEDQVLRIPKSEQESLEKTKNFIDQVIKKLVDSSFIGYMNVIEVDPEVSKKLLLQSKRLDKSINYIPKKAYLMENHLIISRQHKNFSIEIKPKWGYKPNVKGNPIKSKTCRFHMHLHYKKKDDSEFCPLDLFSDEFERIFKSVNLLSEVNSNNWKVFVDSIPVEFKSQEIVLTSIVPMKEENSKVGKKILLLLVCELLNVSSILKTVKYHQSRLDELDIEVLYELFKTCFEEGDENIDTDRIDWNLVVEKYLKRIEKINVAGAGYQETENINLKNLIKKHLFNKNNSDGTFYLTDGSIMQYKVRLVDVDLKKPKLKYWFELDKNIYE